MNLKEMGRSVATVNFNGAGWFANDAAWVRQGKVSSLNWKAGIRRLAPKLLLRDRSIFDWETTTWSKY
jgi:hypothetical protein